MNLNKMKGSYFKNKGPSTWPKCQGSVYNINPLWFDPQFDENKNGLHNNTIKKVELIQIWFLKDLSYQKMKKGFWSFKSFNLNKWNFIHLISDKNFGG